MEEYIGIDLQDGYKMNGYVKFCQKNSISNEFIFLEKGDKCNIVTIRNGKLYRKRIEYNNIADYKKIKNRDFLLLSNKKVISLDNNKEIDLTQYNPVVMCVLGQELIVTSKPDILLRIDLDSFCIKDIIKLGKEYKEPYFIKKYSDNIVFVVDSSMHTVSMIDIKSKKLLWRYGKPGEPGVTAGFLNVPVMVEFINKDWIGISEQRSHRVTMVHLTKGSIKYIGKTDLVGDSEDRFWAPQCVSLNGSLYIIMCKGGYLSIRKYDQKQNTWEKYFGGMPFSKSDFNFPRSCEFNYQNRVLLIADTYHNRLVMYNENKECVGEITDSSIPTLNWPRNSVWYNEYIFINNSRNREVLMSTMKGQTIDKYLFPNDIYQGEWLVSIDIYEKSNVIYILFAFETGWGILNWNKKDIIYNSNEWESRLKFNDIHSIKFCPQGGVIISDSGNNRIIVIKNKMIKEIYYYLENGEKTYFNRPRMCCFLKGKIWVVNSGLCEVCEIDANNLNLVRRLGGKRGFGKGCLSMPRWMCFLNPFRVAITDTDNHRIVLEELM